MSMDLTLQNRYDSYSVNKIERPVGTQTANLHECGWMEISG